jgi:hypothetical protein
MCFGEPIEAEGRVVIPVARVTAKGHGSQASDAPVEGGGSVDAAPVGFIELGPDGARFEAIPDMLGTARAVRSGLAPAAGVATAAAGMAVLRRLGGRRARGLLPRG